MTLNWVVILTEELPSSSHLQEYPRSISNEVASLRYDGGRNHTHNGTSQQAASNRRISYDSNTEFATSLEDSNFLILYIKAEGRVFDLNCRNRMNGMCAAKSVGRYFGKAEISHFPFSRQDVSINS